MKCISISFKTAPEDIRNKFAFTNSEKKDFLSQLSEFITDAKCVILGTCNRKTNISRIFTRKKNRL